MKLHIKSVIKKSWKDISNTRNNIRKQCSVKIQVAWLVGVQNEWEAYKQRLEVTLRVGGKEIFSTLLENLNLYPSSDEDVWMWELVYKESWALKNWCFWTVVLEKTLESPLDCKEIQPVHPKGDQSWVSIGNWCWSWNSNILATSCEEPTHWKRPWYWERLTAGGEGDNRGWDGWMASPTWWTWIWVGSESWWWTEKPGVLHSMGSQRVGHDWASELNWYSVH